MWNQIEANYIRILTGFGIAIVAALIVLFFYRGQTQRAEAARIALGDVYIALYEGRVEDALAASQEVIETYAGQAEAGEALMALANLHYEEGRIAEARTYFQQYLDEYPTDGPLGYGAWSGLASCLENEEQFAEAGSTVRSLCRSASQLTICTNSLEGSRQMLRTRKNAPASE